MVVLRNLLEIKQSHLADHKRLYFRNSISSQQLQWTSIHLSTHLDTRYSLRIISYKLLEQGSYVELGPLQYGLCIPFVNIIMHSNVIVHELIQWLQMR